MTIGSNIANLGGLTVNNTGTTLSGNISGASGLTFSNSSGGTLILSGNNTFAGGIFETGSGSTNSTITLSGATAGGTDTLSTPNTAEGEVTTLNLRSDTSAVFTLSGVVYNQSEDYNNGPTSSTTINVSPITNGVPATVYAGNTTVGDGTNVASLTATQILQNTLTINANSTVTIAPSGGSMMAVATAGASSASAAASSAASADSSGDSSSDPLLAIQAAIASVSISGAAGHRLESRIAAIERLATTDPGLDVGLLENRVLAALPSSSIVPTIDSAPLSDSGSGLLAADTSAFGTGSSGATAAFASGASFGGSPAAVPEPSTLLLAALGGIGLAFAARRRRLNG